MTDNEYIRMRTHEGREELLHGIRSRRLMTRLIARLRPRAR